MGRLGLTGVSQGALAQPICGALRLLLHHAGGGAGGTWEPERASGLSLLASFARTRGLMWFSWQKNFVVLLLAGTVGPGLSP